MNFIIALTEDNSVNRNTFLQKISMLDNMQLAFIASNGHECLEQLKGVPEGKRPQVIFMDLEMPHMNGIETISLAKSLYPEIHFVVLTVFDDDEKIFEAIKAVMNVLEFGGAPMSPAIARKALQLMSKASLAVSVEEKNSLPEMITTREEEILKHMVNGWDAKRIASVLDISVLTVRKHIANIYDKLHVQSRAEVINMAHHNKWFNT